MLDLICNIHAGFNIHWGHWNYSLIGCSQVDHKKILILHILFFLFLIEQWLTQWDSNSLGLNPADGLGLPGLWDFNMRLRYEAPGNLQIGHILVL